MLRTLAVLVSLILTTSVFSQDTSSYPLLRNLPGYTTAWMTTALGKSNLYSNGVLQIGLHIPLDKVRLISANYHGDLPSMLGTLPVRGLANKVHQFGPAYGAYGKTHAAIVFAEVGMAYTQFSRHDDLVNWTVVKRTGGITFNAQASFGRFYYPVGLGLYGNLNPHKSYGGVIVAYAIGGPPRVRSLEERTSQARAK